MNPKQRAALQAGCFGLEKECLRVDRHTLLPAKTDHPFADNPQISKDFCEAQTEMITPVCKDTDELFACLANLNRAVKETLKGRGELLWNHSNPPAGYREEDVRIAHFEGENREKEVYRNYLRDKYGIDRMLMSGIHFNFSFTEEAPAAVREANAAGAAGSGERCPADALYLKLAAYSMKYAWLITYLTAASPAISKPSGMGGSTRINGVAGAPGGSIQGIPKYASLRCSAEGYWNDFIPILDYTGLDGYTRSINSYVRSGKLYSAWELYLPVRLKPYGANTLDNLKTGVSHIELRMLDLNPLEEVGIAKEDVDFLHLLLMMWAAKESFRFDEREQIASVRNMQRAALYDETKIWIEDPAGIYQPLASAALTVLADMDLFYEPWQNARIMSLIQYQRRKLLNSEARYAERVWKQCANSSESQAIIV